MSGNGNGIDKPISKHREAMQRQVAAEKGNGIDQTDHDKPVSRRREALEDARYIGREICEALITNPEFIQRVEPIWQHDLLDTQLAQIISKWCFEHFKRYRRTPGQDIEAIFEEHRDQLDKDTAEQIDLMLKSLPDDYQHHTEALNVEYLIDRTKKYFSEQAIQKYKDELTTLIDRGEFDKAEALAKPQTNFGEVEAEIICAADVKPARRQWLLPGYIPLGVPTIVAGRPKTGKSQFMIYLAARVSGGERWHGIAPHVRAPRGEVLIVSAEDRPTQDLLPRLMAAAGGTLTRLQRLRVHFLQGERKRGEDGSWHIEPWTVRNMTLLRRFLDQHPGCRLVIIDPISAYMPSSAERGGSGSNVDVRRALAPLAALAAERSVAMVVVTHLRKGRAGDTLLEQILDSTAYGALARASLIFGTDPHTPEQRVIVPPAGNYAAQASSLRYRVETVDVEIGDGGPPQPTEMLVIEGASSVTEEDLRTRPLDAEEQATYLQVQEWLRELLACGPVPQQEVIKQGKVLGYSTDQLRRALRKIGGRAQKEKGVLKGAWLWIVLPEDSAEDSA